MKKNPFTDTPKVKVASRRQAALNPMSGLILVLLLVVLVSTWGSGL